MQTRDEFIALFYGLAPDEPEATPATAAEPDGPDPLPIGSEEALGLDEELSLSRQRVADDLLLVSYFHKPSGALMFEGGISDNGLIFNSFNPYFWRVFINEAPTTHPQVEAMLDGPFLTRLDPPTRRILLRRAIRSRAIGPGAVIAFKD